MKYISGDSLEQFIPIRQMYKIGMNFLGPILGGMLIAFFTIENLAFFNAFTEALTIILLFYISLKKVIEAEEASLYQSFKEGWRYTLRQSNLLRFMIISCILNFLMNSVVVGVPVAAIHYFKLSSKQFGLIEGAFTLGMFVLSLVLSLIPISKNLKRSFQISILMQLGILISLSLMFIGDFHAIYTLILMICIYFVMGLSVTLASVPYSIYLQNSVEESYKGRVLSLNEMLVQSLMPLSFLSFGFLFHFSMVCIFISVATLMCFIFIYFSRCVKLSVE
ncbi:MFS transporter [Staphylococcus pettenkoferi]|uniref:MFS transporter n=2 Tax=Staphylococcus pettenkoferi TaxID=170573 RepID=A0A9Q4D7U9_9STAP|nr:MFS transporter [Staphylococcus pettenkoferi]MCY1569553.1 MFS transporter [Staphylococcus pettenkoferi]MCY1575522.1 MFS transporter [Staphylococcus pettenkoferi]MCY1594434.1 MFS transporter [Staphylococcus pettenkoferi]MCY1618069.1 MFS transporter [Staphylococcus pettenkoferi]